MNLDEFSRFSEFDTKGMITHINALPEQLEQAWELGLGLPLPAIDPVRQVLVAGVGEAAIGADLLAAYAEPVGKVPVVVHRDHNLPSWAGGKETLVIALSHSGNTEESLSILEQSVRAGCRVVVITMESKLSAAAQKVATPVWKYLPGDRSRLRVGTFFGLLLALFCRLRFIPNPLEELKSALAAMRTQSPDLMAEVAVVKNPAKRMAGQIVGRSVTIIGSGILAPVARCWKGRVNRIAKSWAQFEFLPEAAYATLEGIENPAKALEGKTILFLRAPSDHPRNRLRSELIQREFMMAGLGTDFYVAKGDSRLAHLSTALHFGDYVAYYLAMAYGVDPSEFHAVEGLEETHDG